LDELKLIPYMQDAQLAPDRQIRWVSSADGRNQAELARLQAALVGYYSHNQEYYGDSGNGMSTSNWSDPNQLGHRRIVESAHAAQKILEIGCGNGDMVRVFPNLASRYTGVDFSERLLVSNRVAVPRARFEQLGAAGKLPFGRGEFDFVFSTFVIEHAVHPADFLDECSRVLAPGGTLIILCPNFAGTGTISSQRLGFGPDIGSQKWAKGRYWDALLTAWDAKVRMPLACFVVRWRNRRKPRFMINTRPTCFTDPFRPDVDAVYVTDEREIRSYLGDRFDFLKNHPSLVSYARRVNIIFIEARRR
jgi:SAM-dependent methyltransferase